MVLVIPICAVLTLAQFIYLNLNPVDPLTVGTSSVAAVAAIGVGASALVAHAVHALLGQTRRPFNIDSLRTLGSSSNSLKYHNYPRLSFYDPYNSYNTTRLHNVTTLAIDSRQPVQPYAHPSPSVLNTSEWRVPAEPTVELDVRPPSPSRTLRLRYAKDSGSCPLQQPVRNVSAERCLIEISFKLPGTRAPSRPESRPLENGNAIDWRVGCLLGLFVGLACGIPIGSALGQRRFVTADHESRPLSSTPLPSCWIMHTTDESAALTAVKQYSSVLSTIVDSVSKYPTELEALAAEPKLVSETGDSITDDLGTETDGVTVTSEDTHAVTCSLYCSNSTLSTIDPASIPLPEDEPEGIFGDTEIFGTVESILDPTLVPLPEDDCGAFYEDHTGGFYDFSSLGVESGSNMSLCTVVGGVGFDFSLEGRAGDIAGDSQPRNSTTSASGREDSALHTVNSATIEDCAGCSGHEDIGNDQDNGVTYHLKLRLDLTDMLSVVVAGIKESSEVTGAENVELRPAKRRRLLGPGQGLVRDADSNLTSTTLAPANSDSSLLSADMGLDSDCGLTTAHLELVEGDGAGDERPFGLAPHLLTSSKSCPGSLIRHLANPSPPAGRDAVLECVIKRAIPPMVPSSSSPSILAHSVELPRPALVVSMRTWSSSHPGALSSLAAGGVYVSNGLPTRTDRVDQERQAMSEPGIPGESKAKKKRRRSKASKAGQARRVAEYAARRKAGLYAYQ